MAADGNEPSAVGRAAALLGRPVGEVAATPADLRSAAGLLHDLVVWGLDQGLPDAALRPLEARLGQLAAELLPADPGLAALLDWWLTAVVGLPPQQLWSAAAPPLPGELVAAILPGGRPPNLGAEIRARRFAEDRERLRTLVATVPVLSQVAKAQSVVKALNSELAGFLTGLENAGQSDSPVPDVDGLAQRGDALLRSSGVVEGTPLYGKVRRDVEERVTLARAVATHAGDLGPPVEPLPAARVKALTRLVTSGDQVLAGRLLAALGGPPPGPSRRAWPWPLPRRWTPSTPTTASGLTTSWGRWPNRWPPPPPTRSWPPSPRRAAWPGPRRSPPWKPSSPTPAATPPISPGWSVWPSTPGRSPRPAPG